VPPVTIKESAYSETAVILPSTDPHLEAHFTEKPPLRDDTHFAAGKIAIFQYSAVAIFLFLIGGFWRLQVQNPEIYDERALQNSVKSIPITAPRGRILDRDGRVIVDNHSSFRLLLTRETLKIEHVRPIALGLDLDYDELFARISRFRNQPKYVPIIIKEELTAADLAFIESHRDFFPEMELIQSQSRLYPRDGIMAHNIGYTGEISESELDLPEFAKYNPGEIIGKFGLERQYNDSLIGVDGQRQVVVDNRGIQRQVLATKPAVPGKDLQLSIDLDLQTVAELAMDGKTGAVVALDPRDGAVLAMVSRPTFDANKFAVRIKAKDWKEVLDNPGKPMLNRAIQATQAPGSTFKPIVALAALETGTSDETFTVHCPGGATFYGNYYHCDVKTGHGTLNLHGAIVHSCNVYFYTLGNKVGIENISFYADAFGYGHATGIDLPHEASGVVPSPEWALRNYRRKWYAGETISVAIGQGALTITPLQLARAYAGLANGGVWRQPHLLKSPARLANPAEWKFTAQNSATVISALCGVVNEGGTGARAQIPGLTVCGKTGTAQVASADLAKATGGQEMKDNAWFVGFAPREAPEIVVVALYEHSGFGGQMAAPIVRDVMKAYFDKKSRNSAQARQTDAIRAKLLEMGRLGLPVASLLGR
jgi:penicillin-binding protein 2